MTMKVIISKEYISENSIEKVCEMVLKQINTDLKEMHQKEVTSFDCSFSYDSNSESITIVAEIN
ncbi:hypothetical protein [Anaerophilus nitritogenes]|uniref:hypothetical protein n=1 Tax=Anaerophilus nitritogenes TaxID=2498136 RepID=UPI00101DC8D5|nr:hypothetical protein [Anaerophilus nitritogenes]